MKTTKAKTTNEKTADYKKLLWKLAHSFHRAAPWTELEELYSEASKVSIEALLSYEPEKGAAPHTWIVRCVSSGLKRFCWPGNSKFETPCSAEQIEAFTAGTPSVERQIMFKEMISSLSADAKQIARLLLENEPAKILKVKTNAAPKEIRGKIYKHLKNQGWTQRSIWDAFRELKLNLKMLQSN